MNMTNITVEDDNATGVYLTLKEGRILMGVDEGGIAIFGTEDTLDTFIEELVYLKNKCFK